MPKPTRILPLSLFYKNVATIKKKPVYFISGLIWGILIIVVIIKSVSLSIKDHENIYKLGQWCPLIIPQDAIHSAIDIEVLTLDKKERLHLLKNDNYNKYRYLLENEAYIDTHIGRFNEYLRGCSIEPDTRLKGALDNIFEIYINESRENSYIAISDLSSFNRIPKNMLKNKSLGNIYLKPTKKPLCSLVSGHSNIFITHDSPKIVRRIDQISQIEGKEITLLNSKNEPIVTFNAEKNDPFSIIATAENGRSLFIDNNPPKQNARITDGNIVEIGGVFFECRVNKQIPIVETAFEKNKLKRRYPFGALFHFVGPISIDSTFQSLGIEYMFQEYLMGMPEKNIAKGDIFLTFDLALHMELSESVNQFYDTMNVSKASALIMNANTGAILAMASVPKKYNPCDTDEIVKLINNGYENYYNHGCFKKHIIGSTTKPIFAFLALNIIPDIDQMKIVGNGIRTNEFFGHNLYSAHSNKSIYVPFNTDFNRYLYQSVNAYQVSLGMILFSGITNVNDISPDWKKSSNPPVLMPTNPNAKKWMKTDTLLDKNVLVIRNRDKFPVLLRSIFNIDTSGKMNYNKRDISIYSEELLQLSASIIELRNPSIINTREILNNRSVVCAPEKTNMYIEGKMSTSEATSIFLGGNRNMWTDVKLCEAFSRIITERKVNARIVDSFLDTLNGNKIIHLEKNAEFIQNEDIHPNTFKTIKKALCKVTHKNGKDKKNFGTAYQLEKSIKKIQKRYPSFNLLGKTGTLKERGKNNHFTYNSKIFVGTFGEWNDRECKFIGKSYTFVVYFKSLRSENSIFSYINEQLPKWWEILNK